MGHPMRIELTRVGLLVLLANHYTTRGTQVMNVVTKIVFCVKLMPFMWKDILNRRPRRTICRDDNKLI